MTTPLGTFKMPSGLRAIDEWLKISLWRPVAFTLWHYRCPPLKVPFCLCLWPSACLSMPLAAGLEPVACLSMPLVADLASGAV